MIGNIFYVVVWGTILFLVLVDVIFILVLICIVAFGEDTKSEINLLRTDRKKENN